MCSNELAIGDGVNFKGIYSIADKKIIKFTPNKENFEIHTIDVENLSSPEVISFCGEEY